MNLDESISPDQDQQYLLQTESSDVDNDILKHKEALAAMQLKLDEKLSENLLLVENNDILINDMIHKT